MKTNNEFTSQNLITYMSKMLKLTILNVVSLRCTWPGSQYQFKVVIIIIFLSKRNLSSKKTNNKRIYLQINYSVQPTKLSTVFSKIKDILDFLRIKQLLKSLPVEIWQFFYCWLVQEISYTYSIQSSYIYCVLVYYRPIIRYVYG